MWMGITCSIEAIVSDGISVMDAAREIPNPDVFAFRSSDMNFDASSGVTRLRYLRVSRFTLRVGEYRGTVTGGERDQQQFAAMTSDVGWFTDTRQPYHCTPAGTDSTRLSVWCDRKGDFNMAGAL